jgi:hypothetical protein
LVNIGAITTRFLAVIEANWTDWKSAPVKSSNIIKPPKIVFVGEQPIEIQNIRHHYPVSQRPLQDLLLRFSSSLGQEYTPVLSFSLKLLV